MGTRPEIVVVNDFASPSGGASSVAIQSAIGLASRGYRVHFFAGTGKPDPRLESAGIRVSTSDKLTYPSQGFQGAKQSIWDPGTQTRFDNFVSDIDQAVAHVHSHRDALSPSVLSTCITQFSTVYTCHDYALGCPYGCFYDFQKGELCPEHGMSLGCKLRHCNRKTMLHKAIALARHRKEHSKGRMPNLTGVVFVSQFSQRILAPYAGSSRQYVVPNPIEVVQTPPEPDRDGFIFVGAITEGKGVKVAAEAARSANVRLILVGEGDTLESLNADGRNVMAVGKLDRPAMIQTLRRAKALVFPVLWYETQGMVVAEALANGVPVIATSHSAATEYIEDGLNGLLVNGGDVQGLADAMTRLDDSVLARRLAENAYKRYWNSPSTIEAHLDGLERVYSEVADL